MHLSWIDYAMPEMLGKILPIDIAVAYKAFGDVVKMIRNMAAGRGASEAAADSERA